MFPFPNQPTSELKSNIFPEQSVFFFFPSIFFFQQILRHPPPVQLEYKIPAESSGQFFFLPSLRCAKNFLPGSFKEGVANQTALATGSIKHEGVSVG